MAFDDQHFAAAGAVYPLFPDPAFGVFAVEEVVAPGFVADAVGVCRADDEGFAGMVVFAFVAGVRAVRAVDGKHGSLLVGNGGGAVFVYQMTATEARERKGAGERVRFVVGDGVGEDVPRAGGCLEAAGAQPQLR